MRRRSWLSCAPLLALATLCLAKKPPVNVTFPESAPKNANVVNDNFLGISWELSAVPSLWGGSVQDIPDALQNYLANIRARMTSPLRMRVGGNSMDSSYYDPNQSEMVILTDPNAYFNDVPTSIGPVLFDVMNALSTCVGGMEFIIGLSMQNPSNSTDVLQLASAAETKLGGLLDAMTLGNEPDLYAGHGTRANYTISDYIPEINEVMNALETSPYGNLLSRPLLAGPTICCSWNLSDVLNAGMSQLPYKYYTLQHYPTYVCAGQTDASGNITYYLSHVNVAPFLSWQTEGMLMAKQQNVPVLLTEYNSASCGGDPRVAPTFAATLWAVDVALKSAELNYSAVYLHTREVGITYNLFEPVSNLTGADWRTGSPYYTELVVAESLSNLSSVVVDLNAGNSTTNPRATVAAYGIYDSPTRYRSKLVLLNFNYPKNTSVTPDTTAQTFVLPANLADTVGIRYLHAPNITEQTNISWAGQTVQANGELMPTDRQLTHTVSCTGGCEIDVPGPGLAVVWLDPDDQPGQIYFGDSTVRPIKVSSNESTSSSSGTRTRADLSSSYFLPLLFAVALSFVLQQLHPLI